MCIKCRTTLFTDQDVLFPNLGAAPAPDPASSGGGSRGGRKGKGQATASTKDLVLAARNTINDAGGVDLWPMPWIVDQEAYRAAAAGGLSGEKLLCPKDGCRARIGHWEWCGT